MREAPEPVHEDVHIGSDGQLWRWNNGQQVVAFSGEPAVRYAREHDWPPRLVEKVRLLGNRQKRW